MARPAIQPVVQAAWKLNPPVMPSRSNSSPAKNSPGTKAALHGFEIHLAQPDSAARHKFILVQALSAHGKFRAPQLLHEFVLRGPRERRPSRFARDTGRQDELFPKARRQRRDGRIHDPLCRLRIAPRLKFRCELFRVQLRQPVYVQGKGIIHPVQFPRAPGR